MKIHLVRFLVLRTIHGTLVVEVGINSRRVFGGGIACSASGGFFLENSRTKNSRRECRLSLCVLLACVGVRVSACVCMCLCGCVRAYVRAYIARLFVGIQAKKPYNPQKRLKFGLIRPYWLRLLKRIINPNKRLKIEPYGRIRFLSVIQRA